MSTTTTGVTGTSSSTSTGASSSTGSTGSSTSSTSLGQSQSAQELSDRFLKLLVAQMQNQDPLNPMDSAQMTSQMAQISTTQGIQTLNTTLSSLNSQFVQMQTMQGAALVGHEVTTEGNTVRIDTSTQKGDGGFELSSAANAVKVTLSDAAGHTVATVDMGAQAAGRHDFSADIPSAYQGQALSFKVEATANGSAVSSLPLAYNKISSVSTLNGAVALELDNGQRVAYDAIWSFN